MSTKSGISQKAVIVTAIVVPAGLVGLVGLVGLIAKLVDLELKYITARDKAYGRLKQIYK